MAQQTGQNDFIQRILMQLEGTEDLMQASADMAQMSEVLEQSGSKANQLFKELQRITRAARKGNEVDLDLSDLDTAENQIRQILDRLQQLRASGAKGINFQEAEKAAIRLSSRFDHVQQTVGRTGNMVKKKYGVEIPKAMEVTEKRLRHTSQTSQNLLRIMQDAPFGMLGMANNIQALAEDMGRASTQGRGMINQLKQGFKDLITGPFAIPAAITAVTVLWQQWDKVTAGVRKLGNVLGIISDMRVATDKAREVAEELTDEYEDVTDVIKALGELEGQEKVRQATNLLVGEVKTLREEMDQMEEAGNAFVRVTQTLNAGGANVQVTTEKMTSEYAALNTRMSLLAQTMKAVNSDSVNQTQLLKQLKDLFPGAAEGLAELLKKEEEIKKETEKANNEFLMQELIIERMPESLGKTFEEIRLEVRKRNKEIREEFEGQPDFIEFALGLSEDIAAQRSREAFQDAFDEITDQGDAFLDDLRKQNKDTVLEDGFITPFEMQFQMTKEEFLKKQSETFKVIREGLRDELKAVRDRPDVSAEGLFGGFLMTGSVMEKQLDNQIANLKDRAAIQRDIITNTINELQHKVDHDTDLTPAQKTTYIERIRQLESRRKDIVGNTDQEIERMQREHMRKRAEIIMGGGVELTGMVSSLSTDIFETWKSSRQKELENQGKTQEEQRQIMMKEGKKRFNLMKAFRITEATASGIEAGVHAWNQGMKVGGPPVAGAFLAASLAKTAFQIKKLSSLSIGDTMQGSGGGGGGLPGGKFTQINSQIAGNRVANLGTQQRTNGSRQDRSSQRINEAADKISTAADNMQVVMSDSTAESAMRRAKKRQDKFRN